MKSKLIFIGGLVAVVILALAAGLTHAQGSQLPGNVRIQAALGTAFTYQGQLKDGGNVANGAYDFQFALYDSASGGAQIGPTVIANDVTVTNGLFTTKLDFGASAFTGDARYLEIRVRAGSSSGAYTTLTPRQELTAAPYALYAKSAPWSGLTGVPAGFADGVDDTGWSLTGNSGTNPTTNFVGTTDNVALEFRVKQCGARVQGEQCPRSAPGAERLQPERHGRLQRQQRDKRGGGRNDRRRWVQRRDQ